MADAKQALDDLALLVELSDRMADEGSGSMHHPDTLAQRNAVVRRLREFIAQSDRAALSLPHAPDLHAAIVNLPCTVPANRANSSAVAYQQGHRDARHAAAELVAAHGVGGTDGR